MKYSKVVAIVAILDSIRDFHVEVVVQIAAADGVGDQIGVSIINFAAVVHVAYRYRTAESIGFGESIIDVGMVVEFQGTPGF